MRKESDCILALEPTDSGHIRTIYLGNIRQRETVLLQSLLRYYKLLFRAKIKVDEELLIYLPLEICDKKSKSSDRMKRARVAVFYDNSHPRIDVYPVTKGRLYPTAGGFVEIVRQGCPIGISFLPKNNVTPSTYGGIPFDKVCYCDTAI